MSAPTPSVNHSGEQVAATNQVQPSASDPTTAAAAVGSNKPASQGFDGKISSLADLKKKAPKVYNMMMQSIGMGICREMEHHQARLKKLMREGSSRGA